ncbi:hypothetical protein ABZU32_05785 [Sphaerisporangium sp. NPDC005288]|uniref:Uncharacterized protein n=1 Tax=Sphaerisporangium rhizosphaerae TaxID=2269375 RepID=A0ABW2PC62_9ACTN
MAEVLRTDQATMRVVRKSADLAAHRGAFLTGCVDRIAAGASVRACPSPMM